MSGGLAVRRRGPDADNAIIDSITDEDYAFLEKYIGVDIVPGSIHQRSARQRWGSRFDKFRVTRLHMDLNQKPTGHDLQAFISAWCLKARSKNGVDVLRFSTVACAIRLLSEYLALKHSDFQLNRGESMRLKGTIQALENDGRISRAPLIQRVPLGILLVRQLALIMIRNAMWHGTCNWSFVMQDIAIIVIMASLNARAGDIVCPQSVDPNIEHPFLVYRDIELVATTEMISGVKGRWKMRNCKGEKKDPNQWFWIHRHALTSDEESIICPIRLLMILALRSGNLHSTTIEDVVKRARRRDDLRIEWKNPTLPVFCGRDNASSSLVLDRPARYNRVNEILLRASELAGSTHRILPHDVRYGAASDLVTVSDQLVGSSLHTVGAELNHSRAATNGGVTRRYTRMFNSQDTWNVRSNISKDDQPFTDLQFSTPLIGRPPKLPAIPSKERNSRFINEFEARGHSSPKHITNTKSTSRPALHGLPAAQLDDPPKQLKGAVRKTPAHSEADISAECIRLQRDPEDKAERKKAKDRLKPRASHPPKSKPSKPKTANPSTIDNVNVHLSAIGVGADSSKYAWLSQASSSSVEKPHAKAGSCQEISVESVDENVPLVTSSEHAAFQIDIDCLRWGKDPQDLKARRQVHRHSQLTEVLALQSLEEDPQREIERLRKALLSVARECGGLRSQLTSLTTEPKKRKAQSTDEGSKKRRKTLEVSEAGTDDQPASSEQDNQRSKSPFVVPGAPASISSNEHAILRPSIETCNSSIIPDGMRVDQNLVIEETGADASQVSICGSNDSTYGLQDQEKELSDRPQKTSKEGEVLQAIFSKAIVEEEADLQQLMQEDIQDTECEDDGEHPPNDPDSAASLTSASFVNHFSSINIVWMFTELRPIGPLPLTWRKAAEIGANVLNSVRAPTQFRYWCKYQTQGCGYASPDKGVFTSHEKNCLFKNGPPGKKHRRTIQVEWPRSCPVEGCSDTDEFGDRASLQAHNLLHHPAKGVMRGVQEDFSCPLQDCRVKKTTNGGLRQHLRDVHHLEAAEIDCLGPVRLPGTQLCTFPGCESLQMFRKQELYAHLEVHGIVNVREKKEYTVNRILGLEPPMLQKK